MALTDKLKAIGNAIRSKTGKSGSLTLEQMVAEINNIQTSSSKNIQAYHGYNTTTQTSYTSVGVSLTVAKTGTYTVSWMCYRNRNSGTFGSQLYIGGRASGSANTTWVNTYGQSVKLTNVSLTAGQTIEVRGRSGNTSYVIGIGNLIIEEQ